MAIGIFTLIYAWIKLGIGFNAILLIKLIVYLITTSLVMMAMQNAGAASCFFVDNSFFILDLVHRLREYAKYPITIFSPVFRFIFTFVFPIAFISYYPSLVILRPDNVPLLSWISPFVGVAFFYLSYKFWMFGASRYNGTGS